jgi:hypothetical protein
VTPDLQIDPELQTPARELGLGSVERSPCVARFRSDDDGAECGIGEVRQGEHEAVDLEHLGSRDVRPASALGDDEPACETFGRLHDPSLPGSPTGRRDGSGPR